MKYALRTRLAAGLAISFVLLAGLQWLLAGIAIERLLKAQLAQRLERDAENLLAALDGDAGAPLQLDDARIGGEYRQPFSGHYFRIVIDGGDDISSRSLWDGTLALPSAGSERIAQSEAAGPQGQSLWLLSARYEKRGQSVRILVAEDLSALRAGLREWHLLYGVLTLAVVALVLAVQQWVVRRSLAPLDTLRAQMQALERGERERLDVALPDEIAPLVDQFNALLGMLLRRSQRSRDALGNLAHALKTRLAVLLQVAESPAMAAHPELQQRMTDSTELMRRAIERELRRARLMGGTHPARRSDLRDAAERLAATLAILHGERSPDIALDIAADVTLAMDAEDLMELLGNLMDNACAWCRRRVRLSVERGADLKLLIEDDGPGCAPEQLESLSARGFRADETKPGHGLGLSIVRDLVDSYGGALEFGPSPVLGGLRVTVHLPSRMALDAPSPEGVRP
ncbi:MAG: HAMP domain-containing protein [Methyloversatilis discipulorum]|uniref:ATP-binding protein n=1 Tax=Methyloversatilis discipulorum TaxID=1119528 RepID=UPI0026ED2CF2|nr:ATP-binding protein [Methyloversatilis discipulorum]MBT9516267.1 HAMP domain-containing protein [Methyloversatilis discipulorum]